MDKSAKAVNGWFKKANEDLIVANGLFAMQNNQVWAAIGFHCQQAAEKALKGYLVCSNIPFSKTHDIGHLLTLIPDNARDLNQLLIAASDLTPFAVEYRYPDAARGELTLSDISSAMTVAREVVTELAKRVAHQTNEEIL